MVSRSRARPRTQISHRWRPDDRFFCDGEGITDLSPLSGWSAVPRAFSAELDATAIRGSHTLCAALKGLRTLPPPWHDHGSGELAEKMKPSFSVGTAGGESSGFCAAVVLSSAGEISIAVSDLQPSHQRPEQTSKTQNFSNNMPTLDLCIRIVAVLPMCPCPIYHQHTKICGVTLLWRHTHLPETFTGDNRSTFKLSCLQQTRYLLVLCCFVSLPRW